MPLLGKSPADIISMLKGSLPPAALLGGATMGAEDAEAGPLAHGTKRMLDPRYGNAVNGGNRKFAHERAESVPASISSRPMQYDVGLDLRQYEGSPYILTQSDRTAAGGVVQSVNGKDIDPVDLRGGRDFMFDSPSEGMVWASAPNVVSRLHGQAGALRSMTGKDPLFLPYAMAPTGKDFATMPLDVMVHYAARTMSKTNKAKLDASVRTVYPQWTGIDTGGGTLGAVPGDTRKAIMDIMDKRYSKVPGGLTVSEARAIVADPSQYNIPDGEILNVGRVHAGSPVVTESGHPTYSHGLPGEGIGKLAEPARLEDFLRHGGRNVGDKLTVQDMRAASMNPSLTSGIIDDNLLRRIYEKYGIAPAALAGMTSQEVDDLAKQLVQQEQKPILGQSWQETLADKIDKYDDVGTALLGTRGDNHPTYGPANQALKPLLDNMFGGATGALRKWGRKESFSPLEFMF